jgi:hypothetical protein
MFDETSENAVVLRRRDNFIVNVLNTICDKLSVELNGRIKAYESVYSRFALFSLSEEDKPNNEIDSISSLMSAYKEDINCNLFPDEVRQFLIFAKHDNAKCPSEMYKLILRGLQSTFPNVETILKIYLTIPISMLRKNVLSQYSKELKFI